MPDTLDSSGAVVALDPGTKFVGVAVSDRERSMAFPVAVLPAKRETLLAELKKVIAERGVTQLIVGRPLALRGTTIPMTQHAEDFAEWLKAELKLPLELVDERLSTRAAGQATKAERVDAVAATLLLDTYLGRTK